MRASVRDWRTIAVLCSLGAGALHLGAARTHLAEYAPAGAFMLVAGFTQVAWAIWVARGAPDRLIEAGMAANAGIVAIWIASRTIGLPVGAMPGEPEHVHGTDVLATVLEVGVIASVLLAERAAVPPLWVAKLVAFAVFSTVLVAGDDPAHERLVAAATIVLACSASMAISAVARAVPLHRGRRSHAIRPMAGRFGLGVGPVAHADGGARGWGTDPA